MKKVSHQRTEILDILWHTQVPSTWSQTVEPSEVVVEVVLPGVSNLKDSVINKNEGDRRQFYSEKKNLEKEIFFDIFWNFVPNITVTYNDTDTIYINEKIQSKRKSKNKLCKIYKKMVEIEMIFQILKILLPDLTNCCQPLKNPIMNILEKS